VVIALTVDEILLTYGPLGIGVLVLGYFAARMVNLVISDRDRSNQQRDQIVEDVFTKVLPAIARNTEVLEKRHDLDREIIEVLRDNTRVLDEVRIMLRGYDRRTGGGGAA
jgi:hypothetical protein